MPNRIIKESICTSDTLAEVSPQAERLFWRLVVQVDDYGCYDGRPKIILGRCMAAMLGNVTEQDVALWLDELNRAGLIGRYEHGGRPYLHLTTWETHQRPPRATKRKYPNPQTPDGKCQQMPTTDDGRRQVTADAPVSVSVSDNVSVSVSGNVRAREDRTAADPILIALQNGGMFLPSKMVLDKLWAYVEQDGAQVELVVHAIQQAAMRSKCRADYIAGILKSWIGAGITTREQAEAAEAERQAQKQPRASSPDPPPPNHKTDPETKAKTQEIMRQIAAVANGKAVAYEPDG